MNKLTVHVILQGYIQMTLDIAGHVIDIYVFLYTGCMYKKN